ncbi:MAG: acetate--CoA ligase family protein [Chloroflexi bacterium]|nr:acetate--CoA ligase family protein [Chloroflexota bacterium]
MSRPINRDRLDLFFNPRRIAIVGASEKGMYPAGILSNLLRYNFDGELYPVNPRRERVFGLPCYPDLTQTPQPADLAILIIPRKAVLPTLQQCLAKGVPAALIISAGFAEADDEGRRLQAEMADLLARTDRRLTIVGPNCAGLANMRGRVIATRLPSPPLSGPVSFVSQSGALMMALYGAFSDRGIGINRLISLGNQVDVNLSEALAYLADDRATEVISAFVESVQNGAAFTQALYKALIAGKPVVLLKTGRTLSGQQAAATHTAALAGSDRAFDAVCRQFGAIQVDDTDELINIVQLLAAFGKKLSGRGRIAIVSQSGGMGSLTADLVELAGLTAPPLSDGLVTRLRALPHIHDFIDLGNPTDVRGLSVIAEATARTLEPFLQDPDTDLVLLLLAKSAVREQDAATANAIVEVARHNEKPLCVVWVGRRNQEETAQHVPAIEILRRADIPIFTQPSDCIDTLEAIVKYRRFCDTELQHIEAPAIADVESSRADEPIPLPYAQTTAILKQYNVPLAAARLVQSADEAAVVASDLGFPIALKAIATDMSHKTDQGLVHLDLTSPEEVRTMSRLMLDRLAERNLEGLLVQRMVKGGLEMIIGITHDSQFGPLLAFGPGGILVELLDEVTLAIPPLTSAQTLAMIRRSRAWPLLNGYRGAPAADVPALVSLIVRLSRAAVEQNSHLHSLDINPVIVMPLGQGAWVVDQRATAYQS